MSTRRDALRTLGAGLPALGGLGLAGRSADARPAPLPALAPADPGDDAFWALVRAQYPLTHDRVYFNTGGLGPAPYPVLEAQAATIRDLQRVAETGHDRLEAARAPVAAFLGVPPDALAFVRNATEATSTIASGLRALRRGDEVLFESHAHPGGSIPWMSRAKQDGLTVRVFDPVAPTPEALLERIERALTPRTKVLQVSHITAPTGIRMPVAELAALARRRALWFHVDGAQAAGMGPLNVGALGCDSYAVSCHKWMGAPHGTGLLYVRPDRFDAVAPTEVGAYSDGPDGYRLPDRLNYAPSARRYEPGTRDAAPVVATAAAAAFLTGIGLDRIGTYGRGLAARCADGLRAIPSVDVLSPTHPALATSITTFRTGRLRYDALNARLGEAGLRCRIVTEAGLDAVRVSTHLFNSAAEVDRLVAAVRQIVA